MPPDDDSESGLDTSKSVPIFMPSVFEQASEMVEDSTAPTADDSRIEAKLPDIEFDTADVADMISVPFDLARIFSKYKGFELTDVEALRLGKKWLRPFQRHMGSVKGMDIYLAVCASLTIVTDKALGYMEYRELEKKEKKRDG